MKGVIPAVTAGLLVGAGLYGLLSAVARDLPPPDDPWLEGWLRGGLPAQFTAESTPDQSLFFRDARPFFGEPGLRGARSRRYVLGQIPADLVILPSAGTLEEIPDGRHLKFRLREKGPVHACRSGRHLLFLPLHYRVQGLIPVPVDADVVERAFDAFLETARLQP